MSPVAEHGYVIYGCSAWNGPRNAEHNYTHALAARHPVLYVDPPLSPLTPLRYGFRLDSWRYASAVADRRLRTDGHVKVFSPLTLPPATHARMRQASRPLLRAQIAGAVRRAGLRRPVVVAFRGLAELAGVAQERLRVGVLMDHLPSGAELLGQDAAEIEAEMWANCAAAELICTTSGAMKELLAGRGLESELLPFGFPADLAGAFDGAAEPAEYAALARPLLGYTGSIDDRLDFDLVLELADRFSHGSLVFVGAVSPRLSAPARRALAARANIHLLGPRTRAELPAYIRYLDVALMPYADSPWIRHASPMKVWEYLYAGPPIVGTGCPDLRRHRPPLVYYAERAGAALELVERALADPAAGREQRRQYALANTWQDRAAQLDAAVQRRLHTGSRLSMAA